MELFRYMEQGDYEQVVMCHDQVSGLRAIIVIHDTTLGPALGGARMWPYKSETEAIIDGLRLAKGMTYKNAAAGLNFGGAKTVIIGDPRKDKSEAMWRALGRFIHSLGGRYITAEDVGTTLEDMSLIHEETPYVAGLRNTSGDPSPVTAYGVYWGMKAAAKEVFGTDSLKGLTVAVQGLGHVGHDVAKHCHEEGAKLIVTDIYKDNVQRVVSEFGAKAVEPQEIFGVQCDIFAPCALGAIINDETIPQLKCRLVAGCANNQLKEERHGDVLRERGILYAPDFIINAGGVINVAGEIPGPYNRELALQKAKGIYDTIAKVIAISKRDGVPTYKAADTLAEERIAAIGKIHQTYKGATA